MEKELSEFVWRESKAAQVRNSLLALIATPLTFALYELPKRIVDAIVAVDQVDFTWFSYDLDALDLVIILASAYMITSFANGMVKMKSNTVQGLLGEELLAKVRVKLAAKTGDFSEDYLKTKSQGELVSMITAELEPVGGLMGGYLARPIFLVSQIFVVFLFLFWQSALIALPIIVLIPVQLWFVPRLQRQLNLMNRERIVAVRGLAASIGSFVQLNQLGEKEFRSIPKSQRAVDNPSISDIEERALGIKAIRKFIYQKKFFLKFLNNSLGSLNPFFIFLIGGLLALQGQISIGAIVACLLAYTSLGNFFRELLAYYNEVQDMSLRWEIILEQFYDKG